MFSLIRLWTFNQGFNFPSLRKRIKYCGLGLGLEVNSFALEKSTYQIWTQRRLRRYSTFCTSKHTKRKHTCMHFCSHVYPSCKGIFTKILLVVHYFLMNLSFEFHKYQRFLCGDICKIIGQSFFAATPKLAIVLDMDIRRLWELPTWKESSYKLICILPY